MRRRRLGAWLILSLTTVGCATTGRLEGGSIFRGHETSYHIGEVGPDWRRITVDKENDLAWNNPSKEAIMQVDSKCNPAFDIPLKSLTAHLLFGFTERNIISQELVPMDGREALKTHVEAKLDGVPRQMLLLVLKKNNCVYDFALITPPGPYFDDAMIDFDSLLAGFYTIARER